MTRLERFITFTLITCSLLSAQNVTLEPGTWSAGGIELTPYSSPTFAVKLADTNSGSPTTFDASALYPFSFFLTNNTGRSIIAYSVVWTIKDPSGFVSRHQRVVGSLRLPAGNLAIPQNGDRLVTIVSGTASSVANNPQADSRAVSGLQSSVLSAARMFPSKGDVTITLEAVVRDDGLALGSDSGHAISRLQAEMVARKSLAADILAAFTAGGDQAAVDLLADIVDAKGGANFLTASRMSSASDAYAAFLSAYRRQFAVGFLGLARNRPEQLITLVKSRLLTENGVAVHR